jgi:GlpG protein
MRHIGSVNERNHAERFLAFLISQDINAVVEHESDQYEIWVKEEDHLGPASKFFDEFIENPDDPVYSDAIQSAREIRAAKQRKAEMARKNVVSMNQHWNRPAIQKAPITIILIVISTAVYLMSGQGKDHDNRLFNMLTYTSISNERGSEIISEHGRTSAELTMANIARGEIWRLVTPMFLHFSVAHIVFNMIWLFTFGQQVEVKFGRWKYLVIILIIAFTSNTMQCIVPLEWDGARPALVADSLNYVMLVGGMSGVVYGLFGLAWIRSRLDPKSGFFVPPLTVILMLGWMVFCMMPFSVQLVGNIANWAHAVGLIVGITIGFWSLRFGKK